jgi:hypothetical protein
MSLKGGRYRHGGLSLEGELFLVMHCEAPQREREERGPRARRLPGSAAVLASDLTEL